MRYTKFEGVGSFRPSPASNLLDFVYLSLTSNPTAFTFARPDTDNIPKDSDSDLDFLFLCDLDTCTALHVCNGVWWGYGEAERVAARPSPGAHETFLPMKPWGERPVGSRGWGMLATFLTRGCS
jgi:hypothetical protein